MRARTSCGSERASFFAAGATETSLSSVPSGGDHFERQDSVSHVLASTRQSLNCPLRVRMFVAQR